MRALLDKYLLVRPRTKEFLLGHPALFFALAAAASGRFPQWVAAAAGRRRHRAVVAAGHVLPPAHAAVDLRSCAA